MSTDILTMPSCVCGGACLKVADISTSPVACVLEKASLSGVHFSLDEGQLFADGADDAVDAFIPDLKLYKAAVTRYLELEGRDLEASTQWLVETSDRGQIKVNCYPPLTEAEILFQVPGAVLAAPYMQDMPAYSGGGT